MSAQNISKGGVYSIYWPNVYVEMFKLSVNVYVEMFKLSVNVYVQFVTLGAIKLIT